MAREKNELSVQLVELARREAGLKIQINDFKRLQGIIYHSQGISVIFSHNYSVLRDLNTVLEL